MSTLYSIRLPNVWHSFIYIVNYLIAIFNQSLLNAAARYKSLNTLEYARDCPICLEHIPYGPNYTSTLCNHAFHSSCLIAYACTSLTPNNAFRGNMRCPVCRLNITDIHPSDISNIEDIDVVLPKMISTMTIGGPDYTPTRCQLLKAFVHSEYYDETITMPYLSSYIKVKRMLSRAEDINNK